MFHGPQLENIGIFFSLQIHLKLISQRTKQKKKTENVCTYKSVCLYNLVLIPPAFNENPLCVRHSEGH